MEDSRIYFNLCTRKTTLRVTAILIFRTFGRWSRRQQCSSGRVYGSDAAWEDFITSLAPYEFPLLAYEGGQNFANGSTDALNNLYMAANRDPRMGQAYTRYFRQWKNGGGQLFMYYNDVGVESKYGSWGALESIMQTTTPLSSAPPKWQAIQNFISGILVGGRVVRARSMRGKIVRSSRLQRHGGINDRSISYSPYSNRLGLVVGTLGSLAVVATCGEECGLRGKVEALRRSRGAGYHGCRHRVGRVGDAGVCPR